MDRRPAEIAGGRRATNDSGERKSPLSLCLRRVESYVQRDKPGAWQESPVPPEARKRSPRTIDERTPTGVTSSTSLGYLRLDLLLSGRRDKANPTGGRRPIPSGSQSRSYPLFSLALRSHPRPHPLPWPPKLLSIRSAHRLLCHAASCSLTAPSSGTSPHAATAQYYPHLVARVITRLQSHAGDPCSRTVLCSTDGFVRQPVRALGERECAPACAASGIRELTAFPDASRRQSLA